MPLTKQTPGSLSGMKTTLIFIFCCLIALAQKAPAQTAGHDSTAKADTAKPLPRNERLREITARRNAMLLPAPPYSGAPAKAARRDARMFRLPKDMLLKLRAGNIPATSNYFNPTATTASNPALLTDSGYVQTYRYYAFNAAQRQIINPAGTRLLIGGAAVVFAALTVALIVVFSHSKG
jgi:hypothetical protein